MQHVMCTLCSKLANGLIDLRWWIIKVKVTTTALSALPLERLGLTKTWLKVGKMVIMSKIVADCK